MKRDMDLVRSVLLLVEANPSPEEPIIPFEVAGYDAVSVYHHVQLLHEAGMLTAMERQAIGLYEWWPIALTWSGHDFLDSVRNPETWKKTKGVATAAGGFTLDLLKDLAKGLIKKQIEEHTDVKL